MTLPMDKQAQWGLKWPAPAKLNLMLHIVGQRNDGYHLLQTVFQFIEMSDWLIFHALEDNRVCLKQAVPGVPEDANLIVRAARLLKAEAGCQQGVCIAVEKHLPMGGGLGGGSSDAATTLLVLNHLWSLGLSVQRLMQLGLALGADVPVFIHGKSAWAEGVGEQLQDIGLPEPWFVIIKPDCHVVTKDVFFAQDLTRDSKSIRIDDFASGQTRNDCLDVVLKLYPAVAKAFAALSEFGVARLTGTGACVFAQFDDECQAQQAFCALEKEWVVFLSKGMNVSPLRKQLIELDNL